MNEHEERKLDAVLDAALARYAAAEPLHGLEERVLDRLRDRGGRRWWLWGAAAVAATVLVAGTLWVAPREKPVETGLAPSQPKPAQQAAVETAVAPSPAPEPKRRVRPRQEPAVAPQVAEGLPKRDVFPSPTPPDEQVRLLAKYLRRTPEGELLAVANRPQIEAPRDPLETPGGGSEEIQKFDPTR